MFAGASEQWPVAELHSNQMIITFPGASPQFLHPRGLTKKRLQSTGNLSSIFGISNGF